MMLMGCEAVVFDRGENRHLIEIQSSIDMLIKYTRNKRDVAIIYPREHLVIFNNATWVGGHCFINNGRPYVGTLLEKL